MNFSNTYIIIPTFNEGAVVRKTISELLDLGCKIIVIDDGSMDETWESISDFNIHYLKHPINLGQGAALQTGMNYAKTLKAEIAVHFDADGQHDVNDLEKFLSPILHDKADVVLGSRFKQHSSSHIPFLKKLILKQAIWVNGLLTGVWLSDAHNGFRALNKKALSTIELRENGMAHATEILIEIKKHRLRYKEVPVHIKYTEYSRAKGQSIWNAFNILSDILLRKLFP